MKAEDYLNKVAYVKKHKELGSECYFSKFDDSYITHVGMEDHAQFLADRGITEELTHGVGFSPKENKWYGWSHRAIYGFTVGSTCEKGDCHYTADNPEEMIDDHANFFADISQDSADQHRAECQILEDRSGIRILHTPITLPIAESIEEVIDGIEDPESPPTTVLGENDYSVIKCGKGAWTAKTMEDAKQMAIDFNEGVS
jgi:hypothetical protein